MTCARYGVRAVCIAAGLGSMACDKHDLEKECSLENFCKQIENNGCYACGMNANGSSDNDKLSRCCPGPIQAAVTGGCDPATGKCYVFCDTCQAYGMVGWDWHGDAAVRDAAVRDTQSPEARRDSVDSGHQ